MTEYGFRFTPEAMRIFSKLDPESKRLIKKACKDISTAPTSGKALQAELTGFRSYRTRRYRVIYRVNERAGLIDIIHIGHRSGIYEQLRTRLGTGYQ